MAGVGADALGIDAATVFTIERGITYRTFPAFIDEIYDRKVATALVHGCVLLENVRREDIPPEWTYVDHLDIHNMVHLVMVPVERPAIVCKGNRICDWSATADLPGSWCYMPNPELCTKLDMVLDMDARRRAFVVLEFMPKLQLAKVPSQLDILGLYDACMSDLCIPKGLFAAHLWISYLPSTSRRDDLAVVVKEFRSTIVLCVDASHSEFDFWQDEVFPKVASGERVFVQCFGDHMQIPGLIRVASAQKIKVSVLTQMGTDLTYFDSDNVKIFECLWPILALGIVRLGSGPDDAWMPWSVGEGDGASVSVDVPSVSVDVPSVSVDVPSVSVDVPM